MLNHHSLDHNKLQQKTNHLRALSTYQPVMGGGLVLTRWTNLLQDKYRSLTRRFNSEYAHSEGEHNEDNSAAKSCGMWNKSVTQPG